MAIYYIEDSNGKILSADGKRRFKCLKGQAAYRYLTSSAAQGKRFMRANDEDEAEAIFVEVQIHNAKSVRQVERRKQYVSDCKERTGYIVISIYATDTEENPDRVTGEELIADESIDVEKSVLHNLELETLRLALSKLSEEEMELINALYFCEEPVTERELAEMFNISQPAVHKRKMAVLSKLKNFF